MDHQHQLKMPIFPGLLFPVLFVTVVHLFYKGIIFKREFLMSSFLLFASAATFFRFFPYYNMLYLGVFVVVVYLAVIVPGVVRSYKKDANIVVFNRAFSVIVIFLALYYNMTLVVAPRLLDLKYGRLSVVDRDPVKGLYLEDELVDYWEGIAGLLATKYRDGNVVLLSRGYVNFVPLVYGRGDVLAGNNLLVGLGHLRSFREMFEVSSDKGMPSVSPGNHIYNYRMLVLEQLKGLRYPVLILNGHDISGGKVLDEKEIYEKYRQYCEDRSNDDPLTRYIKDNYVISDVVSPSAMKPRLSRDKLGPAIILSKNSSY